MVDFFQHINIFSRTTHRRSALRLRLFYKTTDVPMVLFIICNKYFGFNVNRRHSTFSFTPVEKIIGTRVEF